MPEVASYNKTIDFALSGHSAEDKIQLISAVYNALTEKERHDLFEVLALRYFTCQARAQRAAQ